MYAQLDPQITQYNSVKSVFNPAAIGLENVVDINLLHRSQWVGLEGAPSTQAFSVNSPLEVLGGGIGLTFQNDMAGAMGTSNLMLAYNYGIRVGNGTLYIGASAGLYQLRLSGGDLITPQGNYEGSSIQHNDNILPQGNVSGIAPDFHLGTFYTSRRFFGGISATHISGLDINLHNEFDGQNFSLSRNYYALAGGNIEINNILIQPSVLYKSDLVKSQADFNLLVNFNGNFWTGLTYRGYDDSSFDALAVIAGLSLSRNLNLTYSFDYPLSDVARETIGSHEVGLNYRINLRAGDGDGKIIYNPRFL